MKLFLSILLFFSTQVLACSDVKLAGMTEEQKFLMAVKNSDFVYFGTVVRLYQVPDTPESDASYNAYVFQVDELIKGKTMTHMDMAQTSLCDDASSMLTSNWPTAFGQEYVAAVREVDGVYQLLSVYPMDKVTDILFDIYDAASRRQ